MMGFCVGYNEINVCNVVKVFDFASQIIKLIMFYINMESSKFSIKLKQNVSLVEKFKNLV